MNTLEELAEVLLSIDTELGNLSIQSDGEVRRRIASAVVDGRELIETLERELIAERDHAAVEVNDYE